MGNSIQHIDLLEGVIVMAAIDGEGRYVPLESSSLERKIEAVKAMPGHLHTIAVAEGKDEDEPADGAYRLIRAKDFDDLIKKLKENGGLFGEALRKRAGEERSALWLPDNGAKNADWEKLYQVPHLKRVEKIKPGTFRLADVGEEHEGQRLSIAGWEEKLGAAHFKLDEPVDANKLVQDMLGASSMSGIFLGPPGSGKSSFLGWLTKELASKKPANDRLRPFPILIRLAEWEKDGTPKLKDYLVKQTKKLLPSDTDKCRQFLENWLDQGRLILLFDGLDEIGDPSFRTFADIIEELKQQGQRFIVSCRTVSRGRYEALDLPIYYIDALTPEQRNAYIEAFPWKDRERRDKLKVHLLQAPNIQALSTNPLMLAFLCHTLDTNTEIALPLVRVELIGSMLNNMLNREPKGRARPEGLNRLLDKGFGYDDMAVADWLGRICFDIFVKQGASNLVFSKSRLQKLFNKHCGIKDRNERDKVRNTFIAEMEWRGILRPHPGGYMFFHLIVQEYLVALELARRLEKKKGLKKKLSCGGKKKPLGEWLYDWSLDPGWEEIMLLTAGLLEKPAAYLAHIYEPSRDTLFRHRLSLAARMTGEIAQEHYQVKATKDTAREILDQAQDIWISSDNSPTQRPVLAQLNKAALMMWRRPDQNGKCNQYFHQALISKEKLLSRQSHPVLKEYGSIIIDKSLVSSLLNNLEQSDERMRYVAAGALGEMGEAVKDHTDVINALCKAWDTADENNERLLRYNIIKALSSIIGEDIAYKEKIIGNILGNLSKDDDELRYWAVDTLWAMGKVLARHEKVIKALLNALQKDKSWWVRFRAAETLGKMGGTLAKNDKVKNILSKKLKDPDKYVQLAANWSLSAIGFEDHSDPPSSAEQQSNEISKTFSDFLSDMKGNEEKRHQAVLDFGRLGELAAYSKNHNEITHIFKGGDKISWLASILGIIKEASSNQEFIEELLKALQDKDKKVRSSAAKALSAMEAIGEKINELPENIIPVLLSALQDEDRMVRLWAGDLFWKRCKTVTSSKLLHSVLESGIKYPSTNTRKSFIESLASFGRAANRPPITDMLKECAASDDQPEEVRQAAHDALIQICGE